ncbi:hypothetical protein SEUCBS139899_010734 [Sporothrix eucalyptigena]|uniref:N-acetyltransferase domain-containing protein n=1 Tax=Sporothrix eucalyptigena TaxID=1812306 RepID=A0ABP0D1K0_9PEZI
MAAVPQFEAFELTPQTSSAIIAAAARTVCHAFSDDPLIRWLRPGKKSWSFIPPALMAWQKRRIYETMSSGRVFGIRNVSGVAIYDENARLPGVAFAYGPFKWKLWLSRLPTRLWLWLTAQEADGSDQNRVALMMAEHDATMASLDHKLKAPKWYIEVVAVDPDLQGLGLGKQLLRHVLDVAGPASPVVLESTKESNIGFYNKMGFQLEHVMSITDGKDTADESTVQMWAMIRESTKTM